MQEARASDSLVVERVGAEKAGTHAVRQIRMHRMRRRRQAVVGELPLALRLDQSDAPQVGQMSRDSGLREAEGLDDVDKGCGGDLPAHPEVLAART